MFLKYLKQNTEKKLAAAKEGINLDLFIMNRHFLVEKEPIPHIIVDNFFTENVYKELVSYFRQCFDNGLVEGMDSDRFHPFLNLKGAFAYDGYIRSLRYGENKVLDILFSAEWNLLFSKIFNQQTDWCTQTAFHYHPPNNRTGFVHHDYVSKKFMSNNKLPNGVITGEVPTYKKDDPRVYTSMRIVSLLYYLNNDSWKGGDGGETGLYLTKEGSPVKLIEPVNNRLFAFQISPRSFHAFQKNFKPRSSIVQWFHVDPEWCEKKYGFM